MLKIKEENTDDIIELKSLDDNEADVWINGFLKIEFKDNGEMICWDFNNKKTELRWKQ